MMKGLDFIELVQKRRLPKGGKDEGESDGKEEIPSISRKGSKEIKRMK